MCAIEGDRGYVVDTVPLGDATDRGFAAHEVPSDFECDDGQDEEQIKAAESGRLDRIVTVDDAS